MQQTWTKTFDLRHCRTLHETADKVSDSYNRQAHQCLQVEFSCRKLLDTLLGERKSFLRLFLALEKRTCSCTWLVNRFASTFARWNIYKWLLGKMYCRQLISQNSTIATIHWPKCCRMFSSSSLTKFCLSVSLELPNDGDLHLLSFSISISLMLSSPRPRLLSLNLWWFIFFLWLTLWP